LSKLTIEHSNSLLSSLVIQTRGDYESKKSEVSSQIECLYERIAFNTRVENVFSQNDDSFMMAKEDIHKKIMVLTSRTALKPLQQLKINAMLLQMIHHRDIIENLIKIHARFSSDWAWQSQLRFNCNDDSCSILTGDTTFLYSFEYQGNEEKLVHTTLTDKCYLNLTQALRLGLGGNLIGPAGTGTQQTTY
jgi:dynein heavy chain 2